MRTIDQVWMVAKIEDDNRGNRAVVMAKPGNDAAEAWRNALRKTPRRSKTYYQKLGYEATLVEIICEDPEPIDG